MWKYFHFALVICALNYATCDERPKVVTPWKDYYGKPHDLNRLKRRVYAFTGIPYAKPPIGDLRFKEPQPIAETNGEFEATKSSPECIQYDHLLGRGIIGEEDCLYLNVYTNRIPEPPNYYNTQPTLVFLHAGTWSSGSGTNEIFTPDYLIDYDITVVTVNSRLGPFGYLSTQNDDAPGNYGLLDQIQALEWVREHIRYFGGMNDSITIMGSGAGGISAHLLSLSPLTRTSSIQVDVNALIHKVISQSGTAFSPHAVVKDPNEKAVLFSHKVGCSTTVSSSMIDCLRKLPAKTLVEGTLKFLELNDEPLAFAPVIDGKWRGPRAVIPDEPHHLIAKKQFLHAPWIVGCNENDGALKAKDILGDSGLVNLLNKNWDKYGPMLLHLTKFSCKDPVSVTNQIRKFYLGKDKISHETEDKFTDMLSDRFFHFPVEQASKKHCSHLLRDNHMCHRYVLVFSGRKSFVDLMSEEKKKGTLGLGNFANPKFKNTRDAHGLGVSFLDEILYLFPSPKLGFQYDRKLDSDEASSVSARMLTYWTNFVKGGDPTPILKGFSEEYSPWGGWWEPYVRGTDYYLKIDPAMETQEEPYRKKAMDFWESLPLYENRDHHIIRDEL